MCAANQAPHASVQGLDQTTSSAAPGRTDAIVRPGRKKSKGSAPVTSPARPAFAPGPGIRLRCLQRLQRPFPPGRGTGGHWSAVVAAPGFDSQSPRGSDRGSTHWAPDLALALPPPARRRHYVVPLSPQNANPLASLRPPPGQPGPDLPPPRPQAARWPLGVPRRQSRALRE